MGKRSKVWASHQKREESINFLLGNKLMPQAKVKGSPLQARLIRMQYSRSHHNLNIDRLARTLFGCISRRLISIKPERKDKSPWEIMKELDKPLNISINYNEHKLNTHDGYHPISPTYRHFCDFEEVGDTALSRKLPNIYLVKTASVLKFTNKNGKNDEQWSNILLYQRKPGENLLHL